MAKKVAIVIVLLVVALAGVGFFRGIGTTASVMGGTDVGGKIVYARAGALWVYSGGESKQLTAGPKDRNDKRDAQPSLSPDGTQIAYVRFDEGYSDIYRLDIDNPQDPVALTSNKPHAETGSANYASQALWTLFPAWSPDGSHIAYTSDVGTQYPGLFVMSGDGKGAQRVGRLDFSQQAVEHPVWSPDGTKIAVATYITKDFQGQIWVLNIETGRWTEITAAQDGAYDPAWSPDGNWLAFTMRQGTLNNIFVVPTDAQKWTADHPTPIQITTDGASRSPAWSPDGTKLAYLSQRDTSFDLYVGTIQPSPTGDPSLGSVQPLTQNAYLDAASGVSWGP